MRDRDPRSHDAAYEIKIGSADEMPFLLILTEDFLIQLKNKRVEELEKRSRSMEDLMERPLSNQQSNLTDIKSKNTSRRPHAPLFSNQSEALIELLIQVPTWLQLLQEPSNIPKLQTLAYPHQKVRASLSCIFLIR